MWNQCFRCWKWIDLHTMGWYADEGMLHCTTCHQKWFWEKHRDRNK